MEMKFPTYDLSGRRALVTGAGSGIGRAAALCLAHYGARVAVCDIQMERAKAVSDEIQSFGGQAVAVQGDVSDAQSVAELFVAQMQDFLGLGGEARTNEPGTVGGNWRWRLCPGQLTDKLRDKIYECTRMYGRLNPQSPEPKTHK